MGGGTHYKYDAEVVLDAREELMSLAAQVELAEQSSANASTAINEAGMVLGALYAEAEARKDRDSMTRISAAWEQAQYTLTVAQANKEIATGLLAAAKALDERADKAEMELEAITDSLTGGRMHPLVEDFADMLEEQTYEWLAQVNDDGLYDSASEWGMNGTATTMLIKLVMADGDWTSNELDTLISELQALRARCCDGE